MPDREPATWDSSGRLNRWRVWTEWLRHISQWMCFAWLASIGFGATAGAASAPAGRAEVEGTVEFIQSASSGQLQLHLLSGTNRIGLTIERSGDISPARFSRIRAMGICSNNVTARQNPTGSRYVVSGWEHIQLLTGSLIPMMTNVAQLRRLGADGQLTYCVADLNGLVLAASPDNRWIAFQDGSGTAILEIEPPHRVIHAGQKVLLEGNAAVQGTRIQFCSVPVVDNDSLHTMAERSGRVFLTPGRHAIRLSWFNWMEPHGLEVYYQGPELPRQKIPDAVLFHRETNIANGVSHWVHGLEYRCYEGQWFSVPDFHSLIPAKRGIAADFDTSVIPRNPDVGIEFSGYLEVSRVGIYTFSSISDDGSLLFIGRQPVWAEVIGTRAVPEPWIISARQILGAPRPDRWAQVEGTVTYASRRRGSLDLVLSSDFGKMTVKILDGAGIAPLLLLHSRVRVAGVCRHTYTTDGQIVAGTLLAPGLKQIQLVALSPTQWNSHPVVPIGQLARTVFLKEAGAIEHIRGTVVSSQTNGMLVVKDATGQVQVEVLQLAPSAKGSRVEALGCCSRVGSNVVLQCGFSRKSSGEAPETIEHLPLLRTVEQIKNLTRAEWREGYPVRIRGVITAVLDSGFFIQDATDAIYARWHPPVGGEMPRVGDYWEVDGVTFAEFAPNIRVQRAVRLGAGTMPQPLNPTWEQLISGSLDTEYVQIKGIITAIEPDGVMLMTLGGEISVQLPDVQPQMLLFYKNALVQIRGCVMPARNIYTQQVVPGRLTLSNASIEVDKPAPPDPFSAPLKRASDLLLFDPRAGAFQQVRIDGQIMQERNGEYFMMDGRQGLRFIPETRVKLAVGDLVEVVGFPELGGPSPVLREAVVRRVGKAPLPTPQTLPQNGLFGGRYDAMRVCVRARLIGISRDPNGQVLELEAGTRGFTARLKAANGSLQGTAPGSLLKLTGVYEGLGGSLASGREIDSFDLLLNSPADVAVLVKPSWWTLRHTLTIVGAMALAILAAVIWISMLHRQVEERSAQLAAEVRRREHTERQRELEKERARIARDLHDDLGATLTQIRFLSALESRDAQVPDGARGRMGQISEKSREMVASLDEIVWAVNPTNDSLPNLANYLCHFAEEFFQPTPIRCRLDVDDALPLVPLTSEVRHNLYLAVREALNNISKHSQATEVWLRIHFQQSALRIAIEDNGHGFSLSAADPSGEGLGNLRQRLEEIGGGFEVNSGPQAGTICQFRLPLEPAVPTEPKQTSEG